MDLAEYNKLYASLKRYEDIARIASQGKYDEETLLVIFTFKTVRAATKKYYRIKNKVPRLYKQWKGGNTVVQLARSNDFPPVLMGIFIAGEMGVSRKCYRKWLHDPGQVEDKRFRREVKSILRTDKIYTPEGAEVQAERGRVGEEKIKRWLDRRGMGYRTENDLRGEFPKTVDFLLDRPIHWRGQKVKWIESKASLGDPVEVRRNQRSQLAPYTKIFGPGMVIYHFGYVEPLPEFKDVLIEDQRFFRRYKE